MADILKAKWVLYSIKLLAIYAVLYFGTLGVIGLSAPEGYHSSFVARYLNYPAWVRDALLHVTNIMLKLCGFKSEIDGAYKIKIPGGHGINVIYGCLGTGVTSFWIAFVAANEGAVKRKCIFIIGGALLIFIINSARLGLLVVVANNNRESVFFESHHTFFNIAAYGCIVIMMYLFDRGLKKNTIAGPPAT